jgi:hypothetical protein
MKKVFGIIHRIIIGSALVGLGVALIRILFFGQNNFDSTLAGLFFLCILYSIIALLISKSFRTAFISKISGIMEKDEREIVVTGKALKATYLCTFILLVGFILLTMATFSFTATPDGHHAISSGFGFSTDRHLDILFKIPRDPKIHYILPPQLFGIFSLLILLQIALFRLFSRKYYRM